MIYQCEDSKIYCLWYRSSPINFSLILKNLPSFHTYFNTRERPHQLGEPLICFKVEIQLFVLKAYVRIAYLKNEGVLNLLNYPTRFIRYILKTQKYFVSIIDCPPLIFHYFFKNASFHT